jgi:hypothetical protein
MRLKRIVIVMASQLLALHLAVAGEFPVSPAGNDVLLQARDAARKTLGPHTIVLAPGRYFNTGSIALDSRDSGLTIRGEPGAEVYGGLPVSGWEKWEGPIWRAKVPKGIRFFNLIVDGHPATMAQTPNAGSGFGGGASPAGNGALVLPEAWRRYDYADAQVFAFIGGNWFSEMRTAKAASPDARGVLPIDGGSGQFGGMNGRFFVRGVLEFLDEPGEWCLKHKDGFVYYWPKSGTPADHVIVRPTCQRLFEISGAREVTLESLSLIGSDFCERWYLFGPGQDGSTPAPLQQGLVFGEDVERLTVRNCRILAAGHSGVWLNHRAQNCVIENCLIQGAGFAGVYANGFMPGEGPFSSAAESYVNKGHRIENNFIFECGKFVGGGCGIQFYQAGDSLITRNEIANMPRYGVSFKGIRWGCIPKNLYGHAVTFDTHFDYLHTRNLKVIGNDIYSVCRNSFDFGGIESWSPGRDNLWSHNALHDIDQTLQWDGWAHVLFADDASHWLTMRDNIIYHCHGGRATGAFMMKSLNQTIENNFVADSTLGRVISLNAYIEPGGNYVIRRNVFASDGLATRYDPNPAVFTGYAGTAGKLPPGVGGIKEVNHNLITPHDPQNPNPLADKGVDTDSVFADAKILRAKPEWDITFRDYALAADSPALKVGFKPIDVSRIGLRDDFPFDKLVATRRQATDKIQAEDYQRMKSLRTNAGVGIYDMTNGSWAKYANIEFRPGLTKAVFALTAEPPGHQADRPFVRRYGDTVVEAAALKGDKSVETIPQWEITSPYVRADKSGAELFDEAFPPEKDITAGTWKPYLGPVTSRAGITSAPGVVDLEVANGESASNGCAYARASIYASVGRTNATMTITGAGGMKVWLNGKLILSGKQPGAYSETKKGVIKQGWNTILVKVNPSTKPGDLWFKFGTVASGCGHIVTLPGLPTEERALGTASTLVEIRMDSPVGELLGALPVGQTECPIKSVMGVHNLFLVFSGNAVKTVDYFRMK